MTTPARPRPSPSSWGDRVFRWLTQSAGVFVLSVAAALLAVLTYQAWPALTHLGELHVLTSSDWNPKEESYGALLFVYGTVATSLIAMLVAVPLGVGSAAYLSEIAAPRVRKTTSFARTPGRDPERHFRVLGGWSSSPGAGWRRPSGCSASRTSPGRGFSRPGWCSRS